MKKTHKGVCACVCVCARVRARVRACACACACVRVRACVRACVCACVCVCVCFNPAPCVCLSSVRGQQAGHRAHQAEGEQSKDQEAGGPSGEAPPPRRQHHGPEEEERLNTLRITCTVLCVCLDQMECPLKQSRTVPVPDGDRNRPVLPVMSYIALFQ